MQKLSNDKMIVEVRKTPMLLSKKSLYRLSDFNYGEWIIYVEGEPKYYFNVFDEQYSQIKDQLKPDVESYLAHQFKKKGLSLSFNERIFGIPLHSKSEIVKLSLRKLPMSFIVD